VFDSLILCFELVLSDLVLLLLVDGFNKDGLVLVNVTLSMDVEEVIDVLGDLLGLSVLLEKSSEDSLSSHPQDLGGHSCVSGTLSLSHTVVSSLSLSLVDSLASGSGVHSDLSLHDKTVLEQLLDVLS
jgi:hypothetical protein